MVAAMDKVGVDGAIFISPFSMYRYDGSYAVEVQQAHPDSASCDRNQAVKQGLLQADPSNSIGVAIPMPSTGSLLARR
jgi:hypothetical protein